jgi:uncharacterized protein YuzE
MKGTIDREADALLLILREGPWTRTQQAAKDVNLELGEDGEVMAIEVLNLSRQAGRPVLDHLSLDFEPEHQPVETPLIVEIE